MRRDARLGRIGLTVLAAALICAALILLVGEQNFLFTKTNEYFVQFPTVGGLAENNPVQLNGVIVGKVDKIILPEDMSATNLQVWITVERRYAERVRGDSVARIKTLGLLGDKFVDIASGSPATQPVEPGGEIPAAAPTDVDKLIASGENVLDNVVTTASSLSKILNRMEQGEGLLGELVTEREDGRSVADSVISTLESVERVADRIDQGEGALGRLIKDKELADSIEDSATRLAGLLEQLESSDGIFAALVTDTENRERFDRSLASLEQTLDAMKVVSEDLRSGDGLLPRLLSDEEYGEEVSSELQSLMQNLSGVADKLNNGEGTAARIINDPAVFEAIDDILVGVEDSRFLRWLIRNRQKRGIKKRYNEESQEPETGAAQAPQDPQ